MRQYIDTSVLTSVYCDEPAAQRAQQILSSCVPVICSLTRLEFSSAVAKKLRMKEFTRAHAGRIINKFHAHIRSGVFASVAISESHYELANDWIDSLATGLRALDALHLAVAATGDMPLATADTAMARAAKSLGMGGSHALSEGSRSGSRVHACLCECATADRTSPDGGASFQHHFPDRGPAAQITLT